MYQVEASCLTKLPLGRQGENLTRQIIFDVSGWLDEFGPGIVELIFQRNRDEQAYPVTVDRDGSTVVWTVTATDTELPGENGHCELRYYVGDTLAKSQVWATRVIPAIPTPTAETPPETEQSWVDQVISVGAAAKASADAAKADADRAASLAAEVSKKAAQTAQDASDAAKAMEAAQTAQRLAEEAQSAADAARTAAETAQSAAAKSATDADAAKQAAEAALKATQDAAAAAAKALADIRALYQEMQTWAQGVIQDVNDAGSVAVRSVQTAGDAQVQRVTDEGATQTANAKAQANAAEQFASGAAQSAKQAAESAAVYDDVVSDVTQLKQDLSELIETDQSWKPVELSVLSDGYYDKTGTFNSGTTRAYAVITPVAEGERYKLSTRIGSTQIPGIEFFNGDTFVSYDLLGRGTNQDIDSYEFVIPAGVTKLIAQSTAKAISPVLAKYNTVHELLVYLKTETYSKTEVNALVSSARYGLRWNTSDPDDLGERCFDAVGKTASVGVGSTSGASDFDSVYPWSEIKRCNILKNTNGAEIVTFEGEAGFALDGSNGDVFVRIPKFCYDRYIDNGYEYHVISAEGSNVHPAFIENGQVLDEIFIGAFEAKIDSNSKLRSVSGVIPTNCIVAPEFLTSAQANGENYSLYDSRCVDAVWNLMAIEFGCRNTNRIIGYGYANYEQAIDNARHDILEAATGTNSVKTALWTPSQKTHMPIGSNMLICSGSQTNILTQAKLLACSDGADYTEWTFDGDPVDVDTNCFIGSAPCTTNFCEVAPSGALAWHTGRTNWISGSNTMNPTRYRWMENLIGSVWAFLPDIAFNNLQMYVCANMQDYEFGKITNPYYPVGKTLPENTNNGNKGDITGANYWITKLIKDYFYKDAPFGAEYDKSLVSTKAFGAYYYLASGNVFISNGGGFDHLYRCNVLTNRAWQTVTTKSYLYGARLMYKHVN